MGRFSQADRPVIVTTPLGPDVLLAEKFSAVEAISQLYRGRLDMLAEQPVKFADLLGQPVSVRIVSPGGARIFHGLVSRLIEKDPTETGVGPPLIRYEAEIVPRLWLLTRRKTSRTFQQKSVPDILREVLGQTGVVFNLQGTYAPRDYCVQYGETDFAFVSRLMEEEGIFYYFRHAADDHTMVIADTVEACPDLTDPASVPYGRGEGAPRGQARIRTWAKAQELRSGRYTVWDYHFELPDKHLEASNAIADRVMLGSVGHTLRASGNETLEIYEYPGGYAERFDEVGKVGEPQPADLQNVYADAARVARLRMEEEAVQGIRVHAASDEARLIPGFRFTLARHPTAAGAYLVTRVEHRASIEGTYTSSGDEIPLDYSNDFECIPAGMPYRPPRVTPKPRIDGTQTAVVTGPPGQELFLDKYGRVKVQFHWDRQGKKDAGSSCWVRVAQTWAGKGWGAFFWPRAGHEVVVSFENGDPDRPLIVGSVYNAENPPPFSLPRHQNAAGIKSCSVGGDPYQQYNAIVFHDTLHDEHLQIHSENRAIITSEHAPFLASPGPSIEVSGSLPFPLGSGSGGGMTGNAWISAVPFSLITSASAGGLKKDPVAFAKALASPIKKLGFTIGTQASVSLFGNNYAHTIGGAAVTHVVDLKGAVLKLMDKAGASMKAIHIANLGLSLGPTLSGSVNLFVGQNAVQTYLGPNINITRDAARYDHDGNFGFSTALDKVVTILTSLVVLGSVATDFACIYHANFEEDGDATKDASITFWMGLSYSILNRIHAIQLKLETIIAQLNTAKEKAEQAMKDANQGLGDVLAVRAKGISEDVSSRLGGVLNVIGLSLYDMKAAAKELAGDPDKSADLSTNVTFKGPHTFNAGDITIRSTYKPPPPRTGALPRRPKLSDVSTIQLRAEGGGSGGKLDLLGTKTVTLKGGREGPLQPQSHILMGSDALSLAKSPAGFKPSVAPKIELTDEGVRIQFNQVVFLELTKWGITLSCVGIKVAIDGSATPSITLKNQTQSIVLSATDVKIEGLNKSESFKLSVEAKTLREQRKAAAISQRQAGVDLDA